MITELHSKVEELITLVIEEGEKSSTISSTMRLISAMLRRLVCDSQSPPIYLHFNNFLTPYLLAVQQLISETRRVVSVSNHEQETLFSSVFELRSIDQSKTQMLQPISTLKQGNFAHSHLYEQYLKYTLKYIGRGSSKSTGQSLRSLVLDHFVRREVARRL